jgi:transcriptional regulator GlxA family with amidase domain
MPQAIFNTTVKGDANRSRFGAIAPQNAVAALDADKQTCSIAAQHRWSARHMPSPRPMVKDPAPAAAPRRFVFVLLDNFTLLSFASALESLRIANRMLGRTAYTWMLIGEGGTRIRCSAGTEFQLDSDLTDLTRDDVVVVCGGVDVQKSTTKKVISWLRREARKGMLLGGLCTASYALAKAGLLDGKRATIHWENQDSFAEEFEEVDLTKSVFVVDGNRFSTAGGIASIDLMLKLIATDHGEELANLVADQFIYSSIRTDQDTQRLSVPTRIGVRHPKLSRVIQMMESHIEEPISPSVLARDVGMSTRQLERLFRRYLTRSPKRYYMELRLQKARNLLMQTDMSVINVALACGFASPSHFSKCYRAHYDTTPYRERGSHATRLSI